MKHHKVSSILLSCYHWLMKNKPKESFQRGWTTRRKNGNDKSPFKVECPDVAKLKSLYLDKKMGSWAIAKEFGTNQRLGMKWLQRAGIGRRTHSEASKITLNSVPKDGIYKSHTNKLGYTIQGLSGKQRLAHRTAIEKVMNRPLKKREVVHHWDEDRGNNNIENLAVFRGVGAHLKLHAFAKRHGLEVVALKFEQPWLTDEAQPASLK